MNAREAMQALLDGKTIKTTDNCKVRLDEYDWLVIDNCDGMGWKAMPILNWCKGVIEEYPLTFEGALRAMLDGKIVEGELHSDIYRFSKVLGFEHLDYDNQWMPCEIEVPEQNAKWKVVE